jgi:hypothetical protein
MGIRSITDFPAHFHADMQHYKRVLYKIMPLEGQPPMSRAMAVWGRGLYSVSC